MESPILKSWKLAKYVAPTTFPSLLMNQLMLLLKKKEESAEGLYVSVNKLLNYQNIPLSNIIGFASDNCATMTGEKSGFQSKEGRATSFCYRLCMPFICSLC